MTFTNPHNYDKVPLNHNGGFVCMKGSIAFEKDRGTFVVWWYVPAKKRSIPLRHYYGIKLYDRELAEKLLALIQGTYEKAKRGECVLELRISKQATALM